MGAAGTFFDVDKIQYVNPNELPPIARWCRAWDLAATKGGGNWTVGWLIGIARNGNLYAVEMERGQWGSEQVRTRIVDTAETDRRKYGLVTIRLPQDPGQAGLCSKGSTRIPPFRIPRQDLAGFRYRNEAGSRSRVRGEGQRWQFLFRAGGVEFRSEGGDEEIQGAGGERAGRHRGRWR